MRNNAAAPYSRRLRQLHFALGSLIAALAVSGLIFHFRKSLGLAEEKMTIVTVHVIIGYCLVAVAVLRVALGLWGTEPDRFRHVFAGPRSLSRIFSRRAKFAGRSPLSRAIATALYAAIAFNIGTGVVRAGTDLYFPPFGVFILEYVTPAGEIPSVKAIKEGNVDQERLKRVVRLKRPFAVTHYYVGLFIIAVMLSHVVGVVATEWSAPSDKSRRGRARLMLFGPVKSK